MMAAMMPLRRRYLIPSAALTRVSATVPSPTNTPSHDVAENRAAKVGSGHRGERVFHLANAPGDTPDGSLLSMLFAAIWECSFAKNVKAWRVRYDLRRSCGSPEKICERSGSRYGGHQPGGGELDPQNTLRCEGNRG